MNITVTWEAHKPTVNCIDAFRRAMNGDRDIPGWYFAHDEEVVALVNPETGDYLSFVADGGEVDLPLLFELSH